ncbi:hypothetical protein JTB14_019673 [Gonioctena quinquepunctata]|nr:hypothetical protein JTB14_019673 [Gonioctena quinquepunctata]
MPSLADEVFDNIEKLVVQEVCLEKCSCLMPLATGPKELWMESPRRVVLAYPHDLAISSKVIPRIQCLHLQKTLQHPGFHA